MYIYGCEYPSQVILSLLMNVPQQILRAILHKKIYPQSTSPNATAKKYLENKYMAKTDNEDELIDKANEGNKWVKTDSECKFPFSHLFCSFFFPDLIKQIIQQVDCSISLVADIVLEL